MKKNTLTFDELNQSLADETKIKTVSFAEYKNLHMHKGTKLERMVAHISSVTRLTDGYEFNISGYKNTDKIVKIKYDGRISVNNSTFEYLLDNSTGHYRINHNGNTVVVEKLIGICECILNDELPVSFKGLCVNCKNGCGNVFTADELGIPSDYSLSNLEWTMIYRNSTHGKYIKRICVSTGKIYKYSANDDKLFQICALKNTEILKEYLENNYSEQ